MIRSIPNKTGESLLFEDFSFERVKTKPYVFIWKTTIQTSPQEWHLKPPFSFFKRTKAKQTVRLCNEDDEIW